MHNLKKNIAHIHANGYNCCFQLAFLQILCCFWYCDILGLTLIKQFQCENNIKT